MKTSLSVTKIEISMTYLIELTLPDWPAPLTRAEYERAVVALLHRHDADARGRKVVLVSVVDALRRTLPPTPADKARWYLRRGREVVVEWKAG